MTKRNDWMWVGALVIALLLVSTNARGGEVWRCPGNVYQDKPCTAGWQIESRGTVISLNLDPPVVYNGPYSFEVGPREFPTGTWQDRAIARYRWETRERPAIVYPYQPYLGGFDKRRRFR